jgi:hypothetical protein
MQLATRQEPTWRLDLRLENSRHQQQYTKAEYNI